MSTTSIDALRPRQPDIYSSVFLQVTACQKASLRVQDPKLRELTKNNLENSLELNLPRLRRQAAAVLDYLLLSRMDDHFIGISETSEFETSKLPEDERREIRQILETARRLTDEAKYLDKNHKRRILFRISKAENELFKEVVGFSAFLAASSEAIDLVSKFGEAAKPLAEAIQTARTKTEKRIDGYNSLPGPEKPIQIEGPKTTD